MAIVNPLWTSRKFPCHLLRPLRGRENLGDFDTWKLMVVFFLASGEKNSFQGSIVFFLFVFSSNKARIKNLRPNRHELVSEMPWKSLPPLNPKMVVSVWSYEKFSTWKMVFFFLQQKTYQKLVVWFAGFLSEIHDFCHFFLPGSGLWTCYIHLWKRWSPIGIPWKKPQTGNPGVNLFVESKGS